MNFFEGLIRFAHLFNYPTASPFIQSFFKVGSIIQTCYSYSDLIHRCLNFLSLFFFEFLSFILFEDRKGL
jgi:hypothetical protein